MGETHYGNAMTEVALALAMAFFSIMILAMVSMGAAGETAKATTESNRIVAAKLAPAAPETPAQATAATRSDDTLLVYHGGRFLDRDLKPADPARMNFSGRVILALGPDVAMAEALAARARIDTDNLVVSMLNETWLRALARVDAEEK
jgi:hypothetical protein